MNKKILVITECSFPIGLATTSRINSYCSGFLENGYSAEVITFMPTEASGQVFNTSAKGTYNGIEYCYPGGTTTRPSTFPGRRWCDMKSIVSTYLLLIKRLRNKEAAFIIFYGNNLHVELSILSIAKHFGIKIYKEESENPDIYSYTRFRALRNSIRKYYISNIYRRYDGILVMTQALVDYFRKINIEQNRILQVPPIVNIERFEGIDGTSTEDNGAEYIAYIGSLSQQKDGILTLVESYRLVADKIPGLELWIAGDGRQEEKNQLTSLIEQYKLADRVKFLGRISSTEIPRFLMNAKLVASCRPKSLQSDYGFPTKVLEYLSSGRPMVSTITGELNQYLRDRVNAFVVDEAEPQLFGAKILEALEDYSFSLQVAAKGRELLQSFIPVYQTKRILEFYNTRL